MAFEFLVQPDLGARLSAEVAEVRALADALDIEMNSAEIATSLALIPAVGGTSHAVDAVLSSLVTRLGFQSQRKNLFAGYPVRLRPDWYLPLRAGGGVLLEVERGKALTNNMDLLDLWKCHICREADHLFLVVPFRVTRNYAIENVYDRIVKRMSTFVEPSNRVNVSTISVFGY